ncbi:acyltransferase family protein [Bradyrhizobium sp. LB12.1]|uniref:acyltransferase family protein n=1 Tax=Bradyrhizobium sp. LB12.1 TaxID=3156327 RepID=UPI003396A793
MGAHPEYRADIDGLRALAVVGVVAFHAFPELLPGGFAGVDVFFVISGYLISGIIFDEVARGSFSLASFYSRRVRRLFPALIIVLASAAACSWFVLLPASLDMLGQQIVAGSAFLANFYFWLQSGYFSPDAHTLPLLHLWSLGVEEQFYIFWPVAVVLLASPTRWRAAIWVVAVPSFILSVALASRRDADFYLPFTRAWELMAGALVAWQFKQRPGARIDRPELLVAFGLFLIVGTFVFLNQSMAYPSWRAAAPVAGAVLVLVAGARSRLASHLLSNRLAVFTGKISYPLYLWHWPVLVLAVAVKFLPLTLLERGAAVIFSYGLAWTTFVFVERPFRFGRAARGRMQYALPSAMIAVALAGAVFANFNGFTSRFPADLQTANSERPEAWRTGVCLLDLGTSAEILPECLEAVRPTLAVWGDSTAGALMPGLRSMQAEYPFGIAQLTASSCMPLLDGSPSVCTRHNEEVIRTIASIRPDAVLLHANGPLNQFERTGWSNTIAALKSAGAAVIVLGPVPSWKRGLPEQQIAYYITHRKLLPERSSQFVSNLWDEESARTFFAEHGAKYLSAWEVFCEASGCLTRISHQGPTAIDGTHLSAPGSRYLIRSIEVDLFTALQLRGP